MSNKNLYYLIIPYGIGGSCTDEITFTVLWHNRWIARLETKA